MLSCALRRSFDAPLFAAPLFAAPLFAAPLFAARRAPHTALHC